METTIPIALLFTIIGALILALCSMLLWRISQTEKSLKETERKHDNRIKNLEDLEIKNYTFRHNFDSVTKNLMQHVEGEIKNLKELMEVKFDAILTAVKHERN